jgi:hypothetical protein
MLVGLSLTAFSQDTVSSDRYIVIDGDTLMTFTKAEVRKIVIVLVKHDQLNQRLDASLNREVILINTRTLQQQRYENLKFQLVEEESQKNNWQDQFFLCAEENVRLKELVKKTRRKKFFEGALIGSVVTLAGAATLIILAN